MSERWPAWDEMRRTMAAEESARTAALDRLEFDPAVSTGGGVISPAVYFATCRTCGAACMIAPGLVDVEQPTYRHRAWHDRP